MHDPSHSTDDQLKVGSLFSGYGGLDLAVEHVFNAGTVWFSEINEPVARVFAHHWPHAPNLGDITGIDWRTVEPVDILCGGFPCQDVSTAGRRAGLAPGTRSGLWAHMAAAIDTLQPAWVVIENVRGLLSATAIRTPSEGDDDEQRNPGAATPTGATLRHLEPDPWHLGDDATRPLRALGAVLGDLADLRYDTQWVGLPASAVGAPHPRFRVFVLAHRAFADPGGIGFTTRQRDLAASQGTSRDDLAQPSDHRPRPPRTTWLAHQASRRTGEPVVPDRGHLQRWGPYAAAIARWEHITGRPAPAPALLNDDTEPRPSPEFVEWLMGLAPGWVTDPTLNMTHAQQLTALGNGVLPLQAATALLGDHRRRISQGAETSSST